MPFNNVSANCIVFRNYCHRYHHHPCHHHSSSQLPSSSLPYSTSSLSLSLTDAICSIYFPMNIQHETLNELKLGCNKLDHQACDELCKQDSFWYGHCTTWDGRDFSCTCYEYHLPLNGSLCNQMQKVCKDYCFRQLIDELYNNWNEHSFAGINQHEIPLLKCNQAYIFKYICYT
ncbi:unnamed protein product [Thelazia callipaeda]|uniref:WSC domain-containing protein n=1 Tax=Thelazia callipaeda TaxID=103827 RepID=A0A0N5D962_THECL|nr:unnamed protein product [Thelazia callipaeda]